jgi:hypothetical protein
MRRLEAWLCILIALTSPFVSQAKVAYGMALCLSEIGGNVLESSQEVADEDYDGRDLVTVMTHGVVGLDRVQTAAFPFQLPALVPTPIASVSDARTAERWHGPWKWPPPAARQRRALLQIFLI